MELLIIGLDSGNGFRIREAKANVMPGNGAMYNIGQLQEHRHSGISN